MKRHNKATRILFRDTRRSYLLLATFLAVVLAALLAMMDAGSLSIQPGVVWMEANENCVWYMLDTGEYVKQEFRPGGFLGMGRVVTVERR